MFRYVVVLWCMLAPVWSWALTFSARVVGVLDGDTLKVVTEKSCHPGRLACTPGTLQVRIRLAEIDAPEKKQPWGQKARQALAAWVHQQPVDVEVMDIDRYGRLVAHVYVRQVDTGSWLWVNARLVQDGQAWVYRKYSDNPALIRLETAARRAQRGLWSLPEAQRLPPWQWRARDRAERQRKK